MNAESLSRIDGFLQSAVVEVFKSYGLLLEPDTGKTRKIKEPFASSIGFTAANLRGVLVLTASRSLAERSLPEYLRWTAASNEILADWTGELSNQILGRVKSRFYASGFEITLSTPAIFSGKKLRHFSHPVPIDRRVPFAGDGILLAEFQADFDEDFEIVEAEERSGDVSEGEALFF